MDDRAERILKFNELTPSMVNIDGAINTDDILNCVAYRKSSAKAKVAAGGSAASLAA